MDWWIKKSFYKLLQQYISNIKETMAEYDRTPFDDEINFHDEEILEEFNEYGERQFGWVDGPDPEEYEMLNNIREEGCGTRNNEGRSTDRLGSLLMKMSYDEYKKAVAHGPRWSQTTLDKHEWVSNLYSKFMDFRVTMHQPIRPMFPLHADTVYEFIKMCGKTYHLKSIQCVMVASLKRMHSEWAIENHKEENIWVSKYTQRLIE